MKQEKHVRNQRFAMKEPTLVETKSKNKVVNIKTKEDDIGTPEISSGTYCEK